VCTLGKGGAGQPCHGGKARRLCVHWGREELGNRVMGVDDGVRHGDCVYTGGGVELGNRVLGVEDGVRHGIKSYVDLVLSLTLMTTAKQPVHASPE